MIDFKQIYRERVIDYHHLVSVEDVDDNLTKAILSIIPIPVNRIIDIGTGTGRIIRLVKDFSVQFIGLDIEMAMLQHNKRMMQQTENKWLLLNGDMLSLPFSCGCADVIIAGWAIGHLSSWFTEVCEEKIGHVLREMERVIIKGGTIIIVETLGTGTLHPFPPTTELGSYYSWLENKMNFSKMVIRTDYQFDSVETAAASLQFFFGTALAETIRKSKWCRVPEWTGVWWKQV